MKLTWQTSSDFAPGDRNELDIERGPFCGDKPRVELAIRARRIKETAGNVVSDSICQSQIAKEAK